MRAFVCVCFTGPCFLFFLFYFFCSPFAVRCPCSQYFPAADDNLSFELIYIQLIHCWTVLLDRWAALGRTFKMCSPSFSSGRNKLSAKRQNSCRCSRWRIRGVSVKLTEWKGEFAGPQHKQHWTGLLRSGQLAWLRNSLTVSCYKLWAKTELHWFP